MRTILWRTIVIHCLSLIFSKKSKEIWSWRPVARYLRCLTGRFAAGVLHNVGHLAEEIWTWQLGALEACFLFFFSDGFWNGFPAALNSSCFYVVLDFVLLIHRFPSSRSYFVLRQKNKHFAVSSVLIWCFWAWAACHWMLLDSEKYSEPPNVTCGYSPSRHFLNDIFHAQIEPRLAEALSWCPAAVLEIMMNSIFAEESQGFKYDEATLLILTHGKDSSLDRRPIDETESLVSQKRGWHAERFL